MEFAFPYRAEATDLIYRVERSGTLEPGSWTEIYRLDQQTGSETKPASTLVIVDPSTQTIIIRDASFLTPRSFWRLVVERR